MNFDFESLSTEPLVYMLIHSGIFVCVLGSIFFTVGLMFGYATWGRYKLQTRKLLGEAEGMKEEIAGLKRKIGDHSVKSGTAIAMATETIHMPKKEGSKADETVPQEASTARDIQPPVPPKEEEGGANLPPKSRANVIKAKAPQQAAPPVVVVPAAESATTPEAPSAEPAAASVSLAAADSAPPAEHVSPLAAIIAAPPAKEELEVGDGAAASLVPADTIPALIELPVTPLPELEVHPEADPKLGLIYKSRPEKTDDLTALKGIAKVLEQRLHDFGIYTYAQIAAWNEDNIKEFSARLAFKDRIQREHWVEQAQQLAAKQAAV